MATIQIELPDEQAANLKARLAERGMSAEEWVKNLVEVEARRQSAGSIQNAVTRILELQKHVKPDPGGWSVKDYINHYDSALPQLS